MSRSRKKKYTSRGSRKTSPPRGYRRGTCPRSKSRRRTCPPRVSRRKTMQTSSTWALYRNARDLMEPCWYQKILQTPSRPPNWNYEGGKFQARDEDSQKYLLDKDGYIKCPIPECRKPFDNPPDVVLHLLEVHASPMKTQIYNNLNKTNTIGKN